MVIEKGRLSDLDELEVLYNSLNDHFESGINYPGWIKHIYPVRDTAQEGIDSGNLFVLKVNGVIVGSIILNHEPEKAYEEVEWGTGVPYSNVFVIHTLVVHPAFFKKGIGKQLMDFARNYAEIQNIKSIRLDVAENNFPAISLYEKCGYKYIGTVDLGLDYAHLKWFRLYELLL